MTSLVIDAGNTFVKYAVFEEKLMLEKQTFPFSKSLEGLAALFNKYRPHNAILCAVSDVHGSLLAELKTQIKVLEVHYTMKLPFQNRYTSPASLGNDRIALVSGAALLYPKEPVLIIDAGTCVTFDLINAQAEYYGGSISPGLQMRYQALHHFTGRLPGLNPKADAGYAGTNTQEAIHAGVFTGFLYEIQTRTAQYLAENENLTIILTGGDLEYLRIETKNRIFANPNFLLQSLHALLDYNLLDD